MIGSSELRKGLRINYRAGKQEKKREDLFSFHKSEFKVVTKFNENHRYLKIKYCPLFHSKSTYSDFHNKEKTISGNPGNI